MGLSAIKENTCIHCHTPIPKDDSLLEAADLIKNFTKHWAAIERDVEAQNKLLHRIIERVYLLDDEVIA